MIGELGLSLGIREDQDLQLDYLPSTKYFNEQLSGRSTLIFLPGIAPSVERAFSSQIEALKIARRNIVGLDYSQKGFDLAALENSICCEVGFNRCVSIIASSFGARVITEILLNNPQLESKIKHLVLLGPFMYLDRKNSGLSTLATINSVLPVQNVGFVRDFMVRSARGRFKYDPKYYVDDVDKRRMIQETSISGLGSRMNYFSKSPLFNGNLSTPTSIVWWEKEPSSDIQKDMIEGLYTCLTVKNLPGRHAFTATYADEVNSLLLDLASDDLI